MKTMSTDIWKENIIYELYTKSIQAEAVFTKGQKWTRNETLIFFKIVSSYSTQLFPIIPESFALKIFYWKGVKMRRRISFHVHHVFTLEMNFQFQEQEKHQTELHSHNSKCKENDFKFFFFKGTDSSWRTLAILRSFYYWKTLQNV